MPLTELSLNNHEDGVSARGDAGIAMDVSTESHACCGTQARATSDNRECQKRAAEDGGGFGSYTDFGYRPSLKAVESAFLAGAEDDLYRFECAGPSSEVVETAFAQGILGSKRALWGGQYSYQAAPIQHFRYDEQDAPIKDFSFGEGGQNFDEATKASDCSSETSYGDKTLSLSESILEVVANVGVDCNKDQETNKTREGLRDVFAARPFPQNWSKEENEDVSAASPQTTWSKEENEEPERPTPSPNPPLARAGLPSVAAQGTCHGKGVGSFGGQNTGVYGGFIWEDALDAGSHGMPMTSDDVTHRSCAGLRSGMPEVPNSSLGFRTSAPLGFSGVPVCQCSELPVCAAGEQLADVPDSPLGFSPDLTLGGCLCKGQPCDEGHCDRGADPRFPFGSRSTPPRGVSLESSGADETSRCGESASLRSPSPLGFSPDLTPSGCLHKCVPGKEDHGGPSAGPYSPLGFRPLLPLGGSLDCDGAVVGQNI